MQEGRRREDPRVLKEFLETVGLGQAAGGWEGVIPVEGNGHRVSVRPRGTRKQAADLELAGTICVAKMTNMDR